jgi:hypothetical protein
MATITVQYAIAVFLILDTSRHFTNLPAFRNLRSSLLNSLNIFTIAPLPTMDLSHSSLDSIVSRSLSNIRIVLDLEAALQVLGTDKCEQDDISVDTTHEDAHDETVIVARSLAYWRKREAGTGGSFDGGGGRGNEVSELVGRPNHESAEGSRGEFHQVDRDDAPGTLDAELLEEGCGDDGVAGHEGVGVEKGASDDADEDDGKSASEDLRAVSDHCPTSHGSEIRDNLRNSDGIGAEAVLVGQHGWVEILGAVGLEFCEHGSRKQLAVLP